MAKNNNKGFSLVEIIVAIAVFAILVIPLTTQLISAIGVNKTSRKKQYAIEKAEGIMENFKVCTFPDGGSGTVLIDGYTFTKINSEPKTKTFSNGVQVSYTVDTYECTDISIGTSYEKYGCVVTVDGLAYAVSAAGYLYDSETDELMLDDSGSPVQTAMASGTIRALDNKQFAIITGATYTGPTGVNRNCIDEQAHAYFNDAKLELLKNYEVFYSQYLSGANFFKDDTFTKYTKIEVEKDAGEYVVRCIVRYVDSTNSVVRSSYTNNVYQPDTTFGTRSGIVYQQSFPELPPIYLLYMPATRDGVYCQYDYIEVDTSGIPGENVDIYLFESAANIDANYEQIITDYFNSSSVGYNISNSDGLIYKHPNYNTRQKDVHVVVNWAGGNMNDANIYANFTADPSSSATVKGLDEDTNSDVHYYDLHVTLTDSNGLKTEVSGTRGR